MVKTLGILLGLVVGVTVYASKPASGMSEYTKFEKDQNMIMDGAIDIRDGAALNLFNDLKKATVTVTTDLETTMETRKGKNITCVRIQKDELPDFYSCSIYFKEVETGKITGCRL